MNVENWHSRSSKLIVQYANCLYIKPEHWRWKSSLQMSETIQRSELLLSYPLPHSLHLHIINWFWFLSIFFSPAFSSCWINRVCSHYFLLQIYTCLTGITLFPCLGLLFLSPVMPQLVFPTSKTDWLKKNLLTSSAAFALGSCFKTSC